MGTKRLYILRHGKSEWGSPELDDIDRPLKLRGVESVRKNLSHIKPAHKPELILSSHAARAVHTAIIAAGTIGVSTQYISIDDHLYLAGEDYLDQYMKHTKNEIHTLMMVGHNPGYTHWVNRYLGVPLENLPTAGLASFVFEAASWQDVGKNKLAEGKLYLPSK